MLTFPMTLTWAEIAALPGAADCFSWEPGAVDDETLDEVIRDYSEAFTSSPKLTEYLKLIGYELLDDGTGITIRSETALHTAHALFNQICHEYDEVDCPRVTETRTYGDTFSDMAGKTYDWSATPTWAMFSLGGDDDVDYCGGQPSCLTDLLLSQRAE